MYLDFVIDIFKPGDIVKIQCLQGDVVGEVIKISPELIAIKSNEGKILIMKDADITDISSFEYTHAISALNDRGLNRTEQVVDSAKQNSHARIISSDEINYIVNELRQKLCTLVDLNSEIKHTAVFNKAIDDKIWSAQDGEGHSFMVVLSGCISKNSINAGTKVFANSTANGVIHASVSSMSYAELVDEFDKALTNREYSNAIIIVSAIRLMTGSLEIKNIQKLITKIRNNSKSYADSYHKLHDSLYPKFGGKEASKKDVKDELTIGVFDETWPTFEQNQLLKIASEIKSSLTKKERESFITTNANIVEVKKRSFRVQSENHPKQVATKTVVEKSLLSTIENFQVGDYCPVSIFSHKDYPDKIILTISQLTLGGISELLIATIKEQHYLQSKLLCYFLMSVVDSWNTKKKVLEVLNILKPISIGLLVNTVVSHKGDGLKTYLGKDERNQEKRINSLIKEGQQEEAICLIDEILSSNKLDTKYKSSLLLKKAQTYSAIKDFDNAEGTYSELVLFIESINGASNNLSHLYTELARLQSRHADKIDSAVASVQKALYYNPGNKYAVSLMSQLKNGKNLPEIQIEGESEDDIDEEGILDSGFEDSTITISKLIDIDIKEHKYTDERIIENGGVATPAIAKDILDEAKANRIVDLSERYPVYLEAAKAFNDLPIGSYDFQDLVESAAYYSILKGNSLFLKFRKLIQDGNKDFKVLTYIKDSACSYYIESLNLQSSIPSSYMLTLFSNYLKLNLIHYNLQNNLEIDFTGQVNTVFFGAVKSEDAKLNEIAWEAVLAIGAASGSAWGKILNSKLNFRRSMISLFRNRISREKIFYILSRLCKYDIDKKMKGGDFLRSCFVVRREQISQISEMLIDFRRKDLDVRLISSLAESWRKIDTMIYLMTLTDIQSKNIVDEVLRILSPYTNRNQSERLNLLIQVQKLINGQMRFINENATYYGRTFFYPLFTKWNLTLQKLLDKKIADTLPVLDIIPDPAFIVSNGDVKFLNLIVKNIGESTAEGFTVTPILISNQWKEGRKSIKTYDIELPAGHNYEIQMNLPRGYDYSESINFTIEISAKYQGKNVLPRVYRFTFEEEPQSCITLEDIPWNDGRIPDSQMFKGRERDLEILKKHYTSAEKDKPYILYGLTRTGKSSILKYLKKALDGSKVTVNNESFTIATFCWDLSQAAALKNAQDLWQYLLYTQVYEELDDFISDNYLSEFHLSEKPRAKDFSRILNYMHKKKIYPLFLVDEFSFIKVLMDDSVVNPAFLHMLRQFSLEELASFIFAGTYDVKELLKDVKYGITGQLVNAIEKQISEIDDAPAEELMDVLKGKLSFTNEAKSHIHRLSGNIPYFIQMICKNCAYYAVEKRRTIIGYPELEHVIKVLTGEVGPDEESRVKALPENVFQNNMFSPADPKEVKVLITTICHLNKDNNVLSRGVGIVELHELWGKNKVQAFVPKLADALELLIQKKVLDPLEDEGLPVYKIKVDLFRRWWRVHHPDIKLEINTILES